MSRPAKGVDSLQTGHPRVTAFEHTVQGNHLAQLTAPVRSARPSLGVDARRDHSQVEVIEGTHLLDECQRLGKMRTSVDEDDLDTRIDLGDKVDEDAVLERANELEPETEAVDRPGHGLLGWLDLETLAQRPQINPRYSNLVRGVVHRGAALRRVLGSTALDQIVP